MFKIFILTIIVLIYFICYHIIDFTKIKEDTDFNYFIFFLMFVCMYIYIHLRFNITKLYRTITPFFLYSFFFWWIPFYLLFEFSTYRVSPMIYEITIMSFTSIIIFYEFFSFVIPSITTKTFVIYLIKAKKNYILNRKFYDDFWKVSLFFSFFFTTLFFIKAGNIPMLASNPEIARVAAMKGSGTIQRFSYLTLHFGVIIFIITSFFKQKKLDKSVIMIIIFLVFYNMLTGPRSYALWALVFIYITYQLLFYKKMIIKDGIIFLSIILLIVAIAGGIRYSGLDKVNIGDTLIRFVNRIYMNPVNANRIVEFFMNKPIQTNSFIIDLSVLLPGYQPDLGTYLKNLFGIQFDGGGITVPLPAEGYMNYGYIGVYLYSAIFIFILKLYELLIYAFKKTTFTIMFMILIPIQFMGIITMGISGIVVKTTIPVIFVFLTMYFLTKVVQYIRCYKGIKNDRIN